MNIRLNFLSIKDQNFDFEVFCKLIDKNESKKKEDTYISWLDLEDEGRKCYEVVWSERSGFNKIRLNSKRNINLTKRTLFNKLREALKKNDVKFEVSQKHFENRIDVIISKYDKGDKCITFTPYYLQPKDSFGFLVDFKFKKNENISFDIEVQKLSLSLDSKGGSNKNYYSDKFRTICKFINERVPNVQLAINNNNKLTFESEFTLLTSDKLDVKNYILGNNNISNSQFNGIKQFGPFKTITTEVKFFFIFEDKFKSFANDIYRSFIGKTYPGTFQGFDKMFKIKLSTNNVERISFSPNINNAIENAVNEIIEKSSTKSKSISIFIESDNKEDVETSKTYYQFKYQLIKNNIPLQVISYKNLGRINKLKWSTSNIALQIFSKLGGIPWLVKSDNKSLILGIGSAHKYEDRKIKKYFAYTVCLDSTGLYKKLEILSDTNEELTYLDQLKDNLKNILKDEALSGYQTCALHIPFKIRRNEIEAIQEAIQSIKEIEFVVVKVNTENKFFGYADNNTKVPYESSFIKLDYNQFLVWFEGLQYGKELVSKRTANPVHIEFLKVPKNRAYKNYLQDIINLSGANWRGFNSKAIPVSIYYSKLIADYASMFEKFSDFDSKKISNIKPWFL